LRILIHGLNYAPELVGVGKYTGEMAEWLATRGHHVRVVTAPPFNPDNKVFPGYSGWRYLSTSTQYSAGSLTVFRCPLYVPHKPSAGRRLVHLGSFALTSMLVVLRQIRWRPDVVVVLEPTLFCLPAALFCARWSNATSWLHIQDFELNAAFDLGLVKAAGIRRISEALEGKLMSRFDRVSTISRKMLAKLPAKGVDPSRCVLFENWVDTAQIAPLNHPSPLRAELGLAENAVLALYSGSVGNKQGLGILLESARRLSGKPELHFLFCTDGPARAVFSRLAGELPNVHVLPLQPLARLNDLLNAADIHLLPQRGDAADLVMPSKLTGMLASGRPVVATANQDTQLANVVRGRGLVVAPEDVSAFATAIETLANDSDLRESFGRNARNFAVSELEKDFILSRFEADLLASRSPARVTLPEPVLSGNARQS
jgi:colanic acid biosynthesis glycosyl transferase WcaI